MMGPVNEIEAMLTVSEVSRLIHAHPNTVRRWSDRGLIPSYRVSYRGDRRFRREDIDNFLEELKAQG